MKTKNLVLMALLIGIGTALYLVMPPIPIGGGIKPDMMLTMMFVGIILFPNVRDAFILSVVTGVLSGLFSSIPGSLIPNIIDKFVTGFVFLLILYVVNKFAKNIVVYAILIGLGTLLSGTVFLSMLLLLVGDMPAAFGIMFATGVIPATIANIVAFCIIYPILTNLLKRSKFETSITQA
ncbi:tryptophan transporter [Ureibacillus thermophilus]|uniref:tryptophan transporter n=1 Tax=Ureibacillus thermophilus TaxID=367743 RepID=UPI00361F6D1D